MYTFRSVITAFAFILSLAGGAKAQELVMFDEVGCYWCAKWTEEIGPIYPKTTEGRTAPLRRVDLHGKRPEDLRNIPPVRVTPTFVLMHKGKEIGRIEGYPGQDFFWGLLGAMLKKIPDDSNWQGKET